MKAIFLMGLLVLTTNVFAKAEPSPDSSAELPLAALVPPEDAPKVEPGGPAVVPADAPATIPVDIMSEEVPEKLKELRKKYQAKLDKKYAKTAPRLAQKEIEVAMIKFNADYQIEQKKQICKKDKAKCEQMKLEIESIQGQMAAKVAIPEEAFKREMLDSEGKLEALASDCFKQQFQEACPKLAAAAKEHEKKFGEVYFTEEEVAAYEKPKYVASKCQWSFDLPRRVISRPGCGQGKSMQTCVGYVICDPPEGTIKVVRMSTCSPENCGDNDAGKCTKEQGFSSKNKTEFFDTASEKVKSVIGAGAVSQQE